MKYQTIQFINDLLVDHYNSVSSQLSVRDSQLDSIMSNPESVPKPLALEIKAKYQEAYCEKQKAEAALEDFNNHQWI